MSRWIKKIADKKLSRRDFLKGSAAATGAVAGWALVGCQPESTLMTTEEPAAKGEEPTTEVNLEHSEVEGLPEGGKWVSAACWFNCGGRCMNQAYVKDNIVLRQKTDDTHEDTEWYPQQRSCLRGHSLRKQVLGADRVKYPMKRKHWEPGGGDRSLRGKDEWERISWEEALDYVAAELKKAKETDGNRSIMMPIWGVYFNDFYRFMSTYGGFTTLSDSGSMGSWWNSYMFGIPNQDMYTGNSRDDLKESETIVFYGGNPAWSSLGNAMYYFMQAKEAGVQFVYVGPSYNESASRVDAKWIRVRPTTDIAFLLAVAYVMITEDDPETNPIIDWDFLNRCTVGFDAEHMPADAKENENFKDYVLGEYDGIPKTPEWAAEICGTPVEDIIWYAREMRKDKKVAILHSFASTRSNNTDDMPQLYMTIGAMGGHFGKPGHACASMYHSRAGNDGNDLIVPGYGSMITNFMYPNPIDDSVTAPEVWQSILDGKYALTMNSSSVFVPREERDLTVHVLYNCWRNPLQTVVGSTTAIKALEKIDCVITQDFVMNASASYSDIVLPIVTKWELMCDGGIYMSNNRESMQFPSQVIEPLHEAKDERWIAEELAKRLGVDITTVFPMSHAQEYFNRIVGTTVVKEDGAYENLVSVTDEDLAEWSEKWGVVGQAQEGRLPIRELMERGIYQVERYEGDKHHFVNYADFVADPEANPRATVSGKLEIYCQTKADIINAMGRETFKGYPTYQVPINGYEASFLDWEKKEKGEYPYQIYNPHYLRRGHTVFDNVPWLREAAKNPVFINAEDAAAKGVKDGDVVMIYNQNGKVLRHASITKRMMPGCIALPHGTWMEFDENGVDRSGSDNVLCAPVATGTGVSGYNTNLVNFEKYDGELEEDCLWPQRIIEF